jgi:hypothetical protein
MIFTSLALLSGMVLFTSAAPWYSPPEPVIHWVNVSNDTAGLLYDPPYIVSQPSSHYVSTVVLTHASLSDRRDWRRRLVQVSSQEPHCDPVQL